MATIYSPAAMRAVVQVPSTRAGSARTAKRVEVQLADGRSIAAKAIDAAWPRAIKPFATNEDNHVLRIAQIERVLQKLIENARVIGGVTPESARAGRDLYSIFVKGDIIETDATTAEMVKLSENTFRDINISFANELIKRPLSNNR